ncbi:MAG: lysophospholipid acyltransferase family protein [Rhodospirillales bacterium]|jgi:1-acyl-sn-glycerol-3-phosphate acyltransferase|nr:1-acyl-sn-glycerol-3-phosphate acyltransferase [Rhodospirillaceae bacterium]MDP6429821.1 lysophospholipid acyltransferase family protein [Rhodospirillales bacterium]MDP6645125.1 lysophospholipid acyltransferase family protein [Rhodospirillales bacterium]MDP6841241.1 lysophospholipid acyltransferase family protein [Rhodospirillales bacterium]|tara:strand:- start:1398 stop:2162 length:765 start_codon:yes stop_codon:yes gene_type:complete
MIVRALIFNILFFGWAAVILLVGWAFLPLSMTNYRRYIALWARFANFMVRHLLGVTVEFRGKENIPDEPVIFASKHQSAWDTTLFLWLDPDYAYIMKSDLGRIPFWSWYVLHCGHILIDRSGGAGTMREMIRKTKSILAEGRSIAIFPEGTRAPPGTRGKYHPGVAALYTQTGAIVVPMALNSGLFWPRRSFRKFRGRLIVEFLPPMPKGLEGREFMTQLEDRIETATRTLEAEFHGGAVRGDGSSPAARQPTG